MDLRTNATEPKIPSSELFMTSFFNWRKGSCLDPASRGHFSRKCIISSSSNLHIGHILEISNSLNLCLSICKTSVPVIILAFIIDFFTAILVFYFIFHKGWLVPISRCFMAKYFKVVLAVASFWSLFNQNFSTSFLTSFFHLIFNGKFACRSVIDGRSYSISISRMLQNKLSSLT